MRELLQPIVSQFDELLGVMSAEPDPTLQLAYAQCISQAMGFARYTIRCDTRCYFNMRSKADMGQLNLPHRTNN